MNEETKNRCEILLGLCNVSWNNFHSRRSQEMKFTYSVWTAFIVTIGVIIANKLRFDDNAFIIIEIIGGIVVLFHFLWTWGIGRANALDRDIAMHYEAIIKELSNSNYDNKLDKRAAKAQSRMRKLLLNWSHLTQLGFTIILYITLILSIICLQNYNL